MKPFVKCIFTVVLGLTSVIATAQEELAEEVVDSIVTVVDGTTKVHLPRKATIYSAVLPGLGQVYNHQWWKVPFIYGGFVAIGYYANSYHQQQQLLLKSYWEIADKNPATNSYFQTDYVDEDFDEIADASQISGIRSNFVTGINRVERFRNLFLIGAAGFYLLNILDANVNAHFLDFDISEDLSLNLSPIAIDPLACRPTPGLTLVFNF